MIKKIKIDIPNLYIIINDISYDIKIKSKNKNREERIIFFGYKNKLKNLNDNITNEFLLDITFKIIPK